MRKKGITIYQELGRGKHSQPTPTRRNAFRNETRRTLFAKRDICSYNILTFCPTTAKNMRNRPELNVPEIRPILTLGKQTYVIRDSGTKRQSETLKASRATWRTLGFFHSDGIVSSVLIYDSQKLLRMPLTWRRKATPTNTSMLPGRLSAFATTTYYSFSISASDKHSNLIHRSSPGKHEKGEFDQESLPLPANNTKTTKKTANFLSTN